MKRIILLIFLSSESVFSTWSNPTDSLRRGFALEASCGYGICGIAYDIGVLYRADNIFCGVRYLGSNEISLDLGGFSSKTRPLEHIWEIDAYVGEYFSFSRVRISLLTGVCVTGGIQRGNLVRTISFLGVTNQHESLEGTVIGVPLQAQVSIMPIDQLGVSVSYLLNINSRKGHQGLIVALQICVQ